MTPDEQEKVNNLTEVIAQLSPEARTFLLSRFGYRHYDLWGTKVRFRDAPGERPHAVITDRDGREIKHIDILGSIEDDLLSIGHPAIFGAIHHWSQIIKFYHALSSDDDFLGNIFSEEASKSLKRIGEMIKEHADGKRALLKPEALIRLIKYFGFDEEETNLHKAWDLLRDHRVKTVKDVDKKIDTIEKLLRASPWRRGSIPIQNVIDFLKTDQGKVYVRAVRRPRWIIVRNAFLAWQFNLDSPTIVSYFSKTRDKIDKSSKIITGFQIYDLLEISDWRHFPYRKFEAEP